MFHVVRGRARGYSEREIALVETFADQAVIAIENARLFSALQESNRQVRAALAQQTATAEVLRVIAASPGDLHTVMQALLDSVQRLCHADGVTLRQADGNIARLV